jgi:hypothetical protein
MQLKLNQFQTNRNFSLNLLKSDIIDFIPGN